MMNKFELAKEKRKEAEQLKVKVEILETYARQLLLPEKWEVGMVCRVVKDMGDGWGPKKGALLEVVELRNDYLDKQGHEYQVFYTKMYESKSDAVWWTTPDDVELAEIDES